MNLKLRLPLIMVAIIGCIATFSLNQGLIQLNGQTLQLPLKLGPVVASALIGLIGGVALKNTATVNHSASFAGMSAMIAIASTEQAVIVGVVVGLVYLLLERMFGGVGGKLGTIAMVSTLIVLTLLWPIKPYSYYGLSAWGAVTPTLIVASIATGALGSAMTLAVRVRLQRSRQRNDAVIGSCLVGSLGGLLLPLIPQVGSALSLVLYEGSFAGMSSRLRLSGYPEFLFAGALAGALFIALYGIFPGVGGKLGFMAFTSVLITQYGSQLLPGTRGAQVG